MWKSWVPQGFIGGGLDIALKEPGYKGGMAVTTEIAPNIYRDICPMGAGLGTPYL